MRKFLCVACFHDGDGDFTKPLHDVGAPGEHDIDERRELLSGFDLYNITGLNFIIYKKLGKY